MTAPSARSLRVQALALFVGLAGVLAWAQTTPPPAQDTEPPLPGTAAQREKLRQSGVTLDKFTRIDILGKMLPLSLTKEQIRTLLPAVEKARSKEFEIRLLDADLIAKLDAEVTAAITEGVSKGNVPSVELQNKIIKTTRAVAIRRNLATEEMIDMVYEACKKNLDAGQMKVMANTMKPELMAPGIVVDTEEKKIRFFIRYIFLDALTYDLLTRMSKGA